MTRLTAPLTAPVLAFAVLLLSQPALAGSMSFGLTVIGSELTLTNQGNSSAFYPAVFRMQSDGRWARLEARNNQAELTAGARLKLIWRVNNPAGQQSELERMRPIMVHFFDQSGVGFGQIAFLTQPPAAETTLKAAYVNGALQIEPPPDAASSIRASWVLWPKEEGIEPIRRPVPFAHRPPPALRIDWRARGRAPFQLDTGAGRPAVILLHETGQGYAQQYVPDGGLQGREQRAVWLDATPKFYAASLAALAFAVGAVTLQFLRRPRDPAMSGRSNP